MIGCPITIENYRLTGDEISYQISDSEAAIIFVQKDFYPVISGLKESYESFLATGSADELPLDVYPVDQNLLFYTSGTTGKPKGAARTAYCDYNMLGCSELGFVTRISSEE